MLPYVNGAEPKENLDDEDPFDFEKIKEVKWYHQVLLNRPLKVVIGFLLLAIATPVLLYHFLFFPTLDVPPSDGFSGGSCLIPRTSRLACGIGDVNDTDCHPQCCYDYNSHMCFHRFPSRFTYITDGEWHEAVTLRSRIANVPFKNQNSIANIRLSIDEISQTHVSLTFYDARNASLEGRSLDHKYYTHHVLSPEMSVMINRSDKNTIFNTARGPIIASDNIWEIAFKLTNETMFGLGEIPLKEDTVKVLYNNKRGLSGVPLIFAKSNGSYHGLLIDIQDPTEVRIGGDNQVIVRSIAKSGIKLHVFTGPRPRDIMREVMEIIGYNNDLEYWMLGAHVCSDKSELTKEEALEDLTGFLTNAARENIAFDSHCGAAPVVFHDDYCSDHNDTSDNGYAVVKNAGKRYVPHISPYIRYELPPEEENGTTVEALESTTPRTEEPGSTVTNRTTEEPGTAVTDQTTVLLTTELPTTETWKCSIMEDYHNFMLQTPELNEAYVGEVGDDHVIYPDYKETDNKLLTKLWKQDVMFDGVILENNWPLDESYKMHNLTYDAFPYFNEHFEEAFSNTPHWYITDSQGEEFIHIHNKYGNDFANAVKSTYGEVPVWSSSQFMNGDIFINRQNINASWRNLQQELVEAALGGISGHWLWSSPICGDTEHYNSTTQTNICVKWYMAATYLPLIKIHSKEVPRDPLSFMGTHRLHVRSALNKRLSLLPYFYTTLQEGPLLRPMFYQFPESEAIQNLKTQFSVGDCLLIVPNLQPSQSHVHVWMPPGTWYEVWSGLPIIGEEGQAVTMTTTEADFLTLIRGGSIVVMQNEVKVTADDTRLTSNYALIVALECETLSESTLQRSPVNCSAEGKLYINNFTTIYFNADSDKLNITTSSVNLEQLCAEDERLWANVIQDITIYGLHEERNNYDHFRKISTHISLCDLENNAKIEFPIE